MKEQLEYQEQDLIRFEDLFENSLIGLHIVGADGLIKRANRADSSAVGLDEDPSKYIGQHIASFHSESTVIDDMLDRLIHDRPLVNYSANLKAVSGTVVPVQVYSNSLMEENEFVNTRCFSKVSTESISNFSKKYQNSPIPVKETISTLDEHEKKQRLIALEDFFQNGTIPVHIVGPDGIINWANKAELKSMGYQDSPEEYIGQPISKFHADQSVIEEMLEMLLSNRPLVDYKAQLVRKDGSLLPVVICSNSRIEDGDFINTRCFTYPVENHEGALPKKEFGWPRNEDH